MPQPTSGQWENLIYAYGACTLIIAVKYQLSQFLGMNPDNHPAEDEKLLGDKAHVAEDKKEELKRRVRQAANDVENIPWNMVVFWAAFGVQNLNNFSGDAGEVGTSALTALIIIYTMARVLYTVCYFFKIQPFRSIFFMIGVFSTLVAAAILCYGCTQLDTSDWVR